MMNKTPHSLSRLLSKYLAYSLLKRARAYRKTHPQMAVFAHDFIGTEINIYGRYEDRELKALSGLISGLDRSKLVLDVGANIGNHTLFFEAEGFEHIHAFEPNPRTLRLLQFNTEQKPQVTAHGYGLSANEATLEALIPLTNAGGASLETGYHGTLKGKADRITFEVKRFDDLAIAKQPVGLLKIDVEGHEVEALSGMMATLRRDKPMVVFECNRKTERNAADGLIKILREAGYENFSSIEPPTSVIPQHLPSILRRPLRLLELLFSSREAFCEITPVTTFAERNYPMVVASHDSTG